MVNGEFKLSCDAIVLIKGKLANGQHRMHAVIQSKKTMPFLVMQTDDEELYKVIDSGVNRTIADAVHIQYGSAIVPIVGLVMAYEANTITMWNRNSNSTKAPTRSQKIEYILNRQRELSRIAAIVSELYRHHRIVATSISGALMEICLKKGIGEYGEQFIRQVYTGDKEDATRDLRERFIRDAMSKTRLTTEMRFALTIKAFNSWMQGTRPGVLRIVDGETFPKVNSH